MPHIDYTGKSDTGLRKNTLWLIQRANEIIDEYENKGYDLTLRQLYYQMVSRDMIPNSQKSYNMLGTAVSTGRERGLIDWSAIHDRLRELNTWMKFDNPSHRIRVAAEQYAIDRWKDQEYRPEVWVEKDALSAVVERACSRLQIPYLVCRGYASQTAIWQAGRRALQHMKNGQTPIVFHLGDHDPSGLHMTTDNDNRLFMFCRPTKRDGIDPKLLSRVEVKRIALNPDQIEQYEPPPNPAKETDSRWQWYVDETGFQDSWELDALRPEVIEQLITDAVLEIVDEDKWAAAVQREKDEKALLIQASERWSEVAEFLKEE